MPNKNLLRGYLTQEEAIRLLKQIIPTIPTRALIINAIAEGNIIPYTSRRSCGKNKSHTKATKTTMLLKQQYILRNIQ